MNKYLLILALAGMTASSLCAAPPTRESVDRLLVAAKLQSTLSSMPANLDKSIRGAVNQALHGQPLTADDEKALAALKAKMEAQVSQEMSWDKVKDIFEKVYMANFSQEEIDGLIAFYSSPVGEVFAEKQPEITQEIGVRMQERMMPVITELRGEAHDVVEQIYEAHQNPAPPADKSAGPAPQAPSGSDTSK